MRTFLLAASAITLFAGLGTAQEGEVVVEKPVIRQTRPETQENEAINQIFYKAFYLQNGAKKFEQALSLYQKFLEEAPHSKLAPLAARNTLNLLYRTNRIDQANEFRETHKALLAQANRRQGSDAPRDRGRQGRRRPPQGGRLRGARNARNAGAQLQRLEERLVELQKKIEEARSSKDMDTVEKLETRLANLKNALKRIRERRNNPGNQGRGRRMRGRRMMKPLTEMNKEELKTHVERIGSMIERFSQRMEEQGMEEQAKKLQDNFKKFKDLVEAGKIKEAQEFQRQIFRRRRRRN